MDACQFSAERTERIGLAINRVLSACGPVTMTLGRISILGAQAFAEVFPQSDRWAEVRRDLGARLVELGEQPITYADTEPIHLNLGLIDLAALTPDFASTFKSWELSIDLDIDVRTVELIVTDFRLTPALVRRLDGYSLWNMPRTLTTTSPDDSSTS